MAESPQAGVGFPRGGVFNASVDAIVVMSAEGLVCDWNPAAERIFGYSREEALGRELASLIVPAALREKHRSGLARWLETGESTVQNRRLELFGLHASGDVIPVELTITRVAHANPPLFVGFLRERQSRSASSKG